MVNFNHADKFSSLIGEWILFLGSKHAGWHSPKISLPPQIGRSADSAIDFVVVESVKNEHGKTVYKSNSTVSRYACRIQCDRRPPYTARLYAAAFDTRGRIQLSVSDRDFFRVTSSHMFFSGNHHKKPYQYGCANMGPLAIKKSKFKLRMKLS